MSFIPKDGDGGDGCGRVKEGWDGDRGSFCTETNIKRWLVSSFSFTEWTTNQLLRHLLLHGSRMSSTGDGCRVVHRNDDLGGGCREQFNPRL